MALGATAVVTENGETKYEPDGIDITNLDAAILGAARSRKLAATKTEAQRRILARYPQWKQANMQARSDELGRVESGRYRDGAGVLQPARGLIAEEISELASFSAAWSWIKAVRVASDLIEADIRLNDDPANINVVTDSRWPT